jgi:hypothetical protein
MKFLIFLTSVLSLTITASAQSTEDSVKAVVNQLFDGMKNADATRLRQTFADSAIMQTITSTKDGKTSVQTEAVKDFADFVSTQTKGAADERISFETIKIDGPLAFVWAPYKFYYNGKFSHCGVDAFHLVRFNASWKIQYLIDTRRKQGCD